jgi:hypothetical protein
MPKPTPTKPPADDLQKALLEAVRTAKPVELLAMFKAICQRIETRRKIAPEQIGAESLYVAYIPPSGPADGQLMFAGQIDLLTQGVVGSMNDLMIEALQIAAQKGAAQYAEQQYAQRGKGN